MEYIGASIGVPRCPDALHEDHVVDYSCSTPGDTTEGPEQRDEVCMITHETLLRIRASSTV